MIDSYLECRTDEELERMNVALLAAHEAELRARLGIPEGESLDRKADGSPAPRVTRLYVVPVKDGAKPGGLVPLDARAIAFHGKRVLVNGAEVSIDVSARRPRAALSREWRDVIEGKRAPSSIPVRDSTGSETAIRGAQRDR